MPSTREAWRRPRRRARSSTWCGSGCESRYGRRAAVCFGKHAIAGAAAMSSQQAVHDLMAQVGPLMDEVERVTEHADLGAWVVVFEARTRIDVACDEEGARLVLTTEVAAVEEHARGRA